jgi:hypothetical protein
MCQLVTESESNLARGSGGAWRACRQNGFEVRCSGGTVSAVRVMMAAVCPPKAKQLSLGQRIIIRGATFTTE